MLGARFGRHSWVAAIGLSAALASAGEPPKKEPAKVTIAVEPGAVAAGAETSVTVRVEPEPGIKINRYPKIKVTVPAAEGLVGAAEASIGNPAAPPPDQLESNYFKSVEPVRLSLHVDPGAKPGTHDLEGRVSYFYCVAASGFCAPAKVAVKIPVTVR